MNDFTYDELMTVLMALCVTDKTKPILKKIVDMLSNYCQHESVKSINPGDTVMICNTCETILSHWNLRKALE